jgi:hypothetical protein
MLVLRKSARRFTTFKGVTECISPAEIADEEHGLFGLITED